MFSEQSVMHFTNKRTLFAGHRVPIIKVIRYNSEVKKCYH